MANDNQASYFRIGLTVLMGAAAIVATLVYLGGFNDSRKEVLAETYYDKPVSGLSAGSVVNFRGVKVGEVRKIAFVGGEYDVDGADNQRIYILMALSRDLMQLDDDESAEELIKALVDRGLRATVASSGITGMSRIEINCREGTEPPAPLSWRPSHVYIPSVPSLLDNFSESVTRAMVRLNHMDFQGVWSNVNSMADSFAQISRDVRVLLENRLSGLERTLENAEGASSSLRELADTLRRDPSLLLRANNPDPLPETER